LKKSPGGSALNEPDSKADDRVYHSIKWDQPDDGVYHPIKRNHPMEGRCCKQGGIG